MRNVLTLKEQLILIELIKVHYTASRLNDIEFTEQINKEHGTAFRQLITRSHILSTRDALDIPSNRPRYTRQMDAGECLGLIARVQDLEERVEKLAATVKGLMK